MSAFENLFLNCKILVNIVVNILRIYNDVVNYDELINSPLDQGSPFDSIYVIKSHLVLNKDLPSLDGLDFDASNELRLLKVYLDSVVYNNIDLDEDILNNVRDILIENDNYNNYSTLNVIASEIFLKVHELEEALSVLGAGLGVKSVECVVALIQIYLSINRLDLALNELNLAKSWSEDYVLLQISETWLNLFGVQTSVNLPYHQSHYILEQFQNFNLLKCITYATLNQFDESLGEFNKLLDKEDNEFNLMNYIVILTNMNLPYQEYLNKLKIINPNNILITSLNDKSIEFDQLSNNFKISV